MNHIYRVIWSHGLNIWVVALEKTSASGKQGGGERRSAASTSETTHPSLRSLASICGLSRQWR
uniref:ESPR domain-containing protein n=1 Tax=Collimonas sp. TaxID=1963772 RepID=UPI0037C0909F